MPGFSRESLERIRRGAESLTPEEIERASRGFLEALRRVKRPVDSRTERAHAEDGQKDTR